MLRYQYSKKGIMNKDIRDYKRLTGFLKPHFWVLVAAFVSTLFYSIINSLSPLALIPVIENVISGRKIVLKSHIQLPSYLANLVDKINSVPPVELINMLLIFGLVYFALRNLLDFVQIYLMNDLSQRVIRDVKETIYKKLLALSMSFYSRNPTAKLMSRITYDSAIIRDAISTGLLDLIQRPLEIVAHFVVLVGIVVYSGTPMRFLITSLLLFPCILLPAAVIAKRLRQITTRTQEKMGDINTILFEIITGIRIVKAFSMQDYEYRKFRDQNKNFYKLEMKTVKRINSISPINEFTSAIYVIIVLYIAAKQIVDGSISAGPFFVFLAEVMLMIKPVKRLSKVYAIIQQALSSSTRIFDILDTDLEIKEKKDAKIITGVKHNVILKDISFRYEDKDVLKNINLEIRKGEIIAIVGPSGSGKTTLVNLIPRFYDPNRGVITIDGTDIKNISLKSLRDQVGIVTQEMLLFNDTVYNNISYGSKGLHTKDDVIKAAKIANAHEFIMRMPDGYETIIGERGFRMSGGERQRISIARAIFKNPPILIFDEATSQLDTESERLVQEAIDRLMEGRTVFVIAHRLSTITHAKKIVVLENGNIVESGSHKELMDRGGLYKRLYDLQFIIK